MKNPHLRWFALFFAALGFGCASINRPIHSFPPAHQGEKSGWKSWDGTEFPYLEVTPPKSQQLRGLVVLSDGWDSSTEDYRPLANYLAQRGYVVMASEIRGQKYDPNVFRRGLPGKYDHWIQDLQAFSRFARDRHPHLPWYLHAHSFGGLVGLAMVEHAGPADQPRAMIVHSPGFPFIYKDPDPLVGALLAPFFWVRVPHLLFSDLKHSLPTNDPVLDGVWLRSPDRLRMGYALRFFSECAKLGYDVKTNLSKVKVPLLVLEGGQDRVNTLGDKIPRTAYSNFMQSLGRFPNRYRPYDQEGHTVFVGPQAQVALQEMTRWLSQH